MQRSSSAHHPSASSILSQDNYPFPFLHPNEITNCLQDLNIPCSVEDFLKPTASRIVIILEAFTDIFMGVTQDDMNQPDFSVMELLEYPDLHNEAIALMTFYRKVHKLMRVAGIGKFFGVRDLVRPEGPRIRIVISAVINFAKFREEQLNLYHTCVTKATTVRSRHAEVNAANAALQAKITKLKEQRALEEPDVEKLKLVNAALTADLRELKRVDTEIAGQVEKLKKDKTELSADLSNNGHLIANLKQECAKLQSRIVQSPEKLQQLLVDMTRSLQADKAAVVATEKRYRELETKIQTFSSVKDDIVGCCTLLEACQKTVAKHNELKKAARTENDAIAQKSAELADLLVKEKQSKRQVAMANEKLVRLQRHQESKMGANEEKLTQVKAEYEKMNSERTGMMAKTTENNSQSEVLEVKTADLNKKSEQECRAIRLELDRLSAHVEQYVGKLRNGMRAC